MKTEVARSINQSSTKMRLKSHYIAAKKSFRKNADLYILIAPVVAYFLIFKYGPMYGLQIAFKNFISVKGIWGSPWVGLKHFMRFFNGYQFWMLMKNTLGVSVYSLVVGFPIPIMLAIMINEVTNKSYKKFIQTVTYAPHFLSTVVLVGMLQIFLSPTNGIVNEFVKYIGKEPVFFMTEPAWFKSLYVASGVWQNAGWGSIIYISVLASIDPQLYEAAVVDGANKFQRLWRITIPCLLPTAIIMLILDVGHIMNVGFEKVFLMQNSLNLKSSDVISTYVYRIGLLGSEFSFSSAVGLFNSLINCTLLVTVNKLSKKFSETSLW